MTDRPTTAQAITDFWEAAHRVNLSGGGPEDRPPYPTESLVQWALDLRDGVDQVKPMQATIDAEMAARVSAQWEQIGSHVVVIRRGRKRTEWDHDALASRVVAAVTERALFDRETGERREAEDAVSEAIRLVSDVFPQRGYAARMTGLRRLGIEPDDYAVSEPAPVRVEYLGAVPEDLRTSNA